MIHNVARCLPIRIAVLSLLLSLSGCIADTTPVATPATPASAAKPAAKKTAPSYPSSVDFGRRN